MVEISPITPAPTRVALQGQSPRLTAKVAEDGDNLGDHFDNCEPIEVFHR